MTDIESELARALDKVREGLLPLVTAFSPKPPAMPKPGERLTVTIRTRKAK